VGKSRTELRIYKKGFTIGRKQKKIKKQTNTRDFGENNV
jgi:hypothetical protein